MTQYLAVKTHNLLEYLDDAYTYQGVTYSGLLDVETGQKYDHPEDSVCKAAGMRTSLENGFVIPVQHEVSVTKSLRTVVTNELKEIYQSFQVPVPCLGSQPERSYA